MTTDWREFAEELLGAIDGALLEDWRRKLYVAQLVDDRERVAA